MKIKKDMKGFTLIELMIVVAVIGVLAAIAIPNFLNYQCKAKQSEAKSSLGALRTGQEAYFAEYDTYSANLGGANFQARTDARYSYTVRAANSTSFSAFGVATGTGLKSGTTVDAWRIVSGTATATLLSNPTNECR